MEHQQAYPGTGENPPNEASVEEQTTAAHWSPFAPQGSEEPGGQHVTPPRDAGDAEMPPGGYQQAPQQAPHPVVPPPVYGVVQPQQAPPQAHSTQQHPVVPPPVGPQFWDQQSTYQAAEQPQDGYYQAPEPPPNGHNPPPVAQPTSAPPPIVQPPVAQPYASPPQSPAAPDNTPPAGGNALPIPYPDQPGTLEPVHVTADDFAKRRELVPEKPVATTGPRAALRKSTFGLVAMSPSRREREVTRATDAVRRNFGGLRQITVVNPKGGAGKTVAVLM
ncbi:MAG: chromosome partitioning protein, partial [Stackebrandtia sp.]